MPCEICGKRRTAMFATATLYVNQTYGIVVVLRCSQCANVFNSIESAQIVALRDAARRRAQGGMKNFNEEQWAAKVKQLEELTARIP